MLARFFALSVLILSSSLLQASLFKINVDLDINRRCKITIKLDLNNIYYSKDDKREILGTRVKGIKPHAKTCTGHEFINPNDIKVVYYTHLDMVLFGDITYLDPDGEKVSIDIFYILPGQDKSTSHSESIRKEKNTPSIDNNSRWFWPPTYTGEQSRSGIVWSPASCPKAIERAKNPPARSSNPYEHRTR